MTRRFTRHTHAVFIDEEEVYMAIWFTQAKVDDLNAKSNGTLVSHLGIEFV